METPPLRATSRTFSALFLLELSQTLVDIFQFLRRLGCNVHFITEGHHECSISFTPDGMQKLARQSSFFIYGFVGTTTSAYIEEQSDGERLAGGGRKRYGFLLYFVFNEPEFLGFEIGDRPTVFVEGDQV